MTIDRVRIVTYITPRADKKVEAFMRVSGLTKAKTCALAIQAGIEAVALAFDPDWKAYFEAKIKTDFEGLESEILGGLIEKKKV